MKKLKKLLVAFVTLVCSFILFACGTIKVYVNHNGQTPLELTVGKKDAEDVTEQINKLEKDGYHVEGVYTDAAYTQVWNGTELKNDQHLYVKWVGNDYNVTYNSNGGTGTMANQTIKYGASGALSNNAFTRTGYSFAGWATTANAQTAEYQNGANFNMNVKGVTLYAVWEVNQYAVSFNANEGTGTMANQNINYGASANLTTNAFVRTGYSFAGWNTKADGTGTAYANGASIQMVAGGITLYAQWQIEKYNIVIKNGNETVATYNNVQFGSSINSSTELGGLTAEAGKTYGGLYLDGDVNFEHLYLLDYEEDLAIEDFGNNGDTIVLNVRWATTEGTVNLHYNGATGGNTISSIDMVYGNQLSTLPTPEKTGKIFIGWYTVDANATGSNILLSKKVTNTTVWQDNFTDVYALWANATSAVEFNLNNGSWNEHNNVSSHTTNAQTDLVSVSRNGYDFEGWALVEPAIIGGEYKAAGTVLGTTIPANSFAIEGTIKLISTWEIQSHSLTFKAQDGSDLLVLEDNYLTTLEDVDGYNYATLYTNMTKENHVFDGWYTSNTNFIESNRFNAKADGKIYYEDLVLYPNFVAKLSAPTNIAMAQNSTIITWDEVPGADYYLVSIDGAEAVQTSVNELETDLLMAIADTYTIQVKACSNYEGATGAKVDSAYSQIEWTRNISLQNALLYVYETPGDKTSEFIKFVVFTGNTYNFDLSDRKVTAQNLSSDDLVDNFYADNTQTIGKHSSSIVVGNQTGTFKMVFEYFDGTPSRIYDVEVVEDINNISYGEAYSRYLTQTNATSTAFLNKENPEKYLVGTANGFEVDFVLTKGETEYPNFDRTDEELLTYSYEVKEGGSYREATADEIPTRNTQDGKLYFAEENAGKEYRITVKFAYSKHSSDSNPHGELTQTFELKLNKGVNVYSHEELKAAYGDHEITEINILRNINPVLSADQVQEDGSPINVGSDRIFDNNDTTSNATVGTARKTDGNIYKRSYLPYEYHDDKIVVNGNYCKIDISEIATVNVEYSTSEGASSNGINHQIGLMTSQVEEYTLLRPHLGVFYYSVPFSQDGATFNNIEIVGNKPIGDLGVDPVTNPDGYTEAYSQRLTAESGAYSGFYIETSKITVNNVLMYNLHHGVRIDGCRKNFVSGIDATDPENWGTTSVVPNNAKVECNFMEVHDTYCNGVYSWEGKEVKVYNSKFWQLNGPAVQIRNEGSATQPVFVMDKHTVVDNYLTGTESWFSLWGLGALAGQLKGQLQPALNKMGASVLNGANEATNLIFIFQPIDKSSTGVAKGLLENGELVEVNNGQSCYCTVYYGGEKAVIEGETLSTGAKSVRDYKHITSSDPRIQDGLHAFGITPFVTTNEFQIAAAITQEFLQDEAKRNATIAYSLGLAAKEMGYEDLTALGLATWDTVKDLEISSLAEALPAGGNKLGLLTTEEQFTVVANNAFEYMLAREVVLGYISKVSGYVSESNPLSAVMATQYDAIIAEIAKRIGKEGDAGTIALLSHKFTAEHIANLVAIYESSEANLISRSSLGDAGFVQLLLLKFAECENIGTNAIEIGMPLETGSVQIILCEYGFQDEMGWAQE